MTHDPPGKSKPVPSVVLLDAVGTLIYPDPPVAEAYHAAALRYGFQRDIAQIEQRFREAIRLFSVSQFQPARRSNPLRTDEPTERLRWQSIVRYVLEPPEIQDVPVFELLWEHFAHPQHWRPFEDALPALERVQSHGLRLGVASNFDHRLPAILRHWFGRFDLEVFVSSEIGWVKPAAEFYAEVTRRLGVAPPQICFLGDDRENDVSAPRRFGWEAELVERGRGRNLLAIVNGRFA